MTPLEAAKALIHEHMRRGIRDHKDLDEIIHSIIIGTPGYCCETYHAQVGVCYHGDGRHRKAPHNLVVYDVDRSPCNALFDVRKVARELYAEMLSGSEVAQ